MTGTRLSSIRPIPQLLMTTILVLAFEHAAFAQWIDVTQYPIPLNHAEEITAGPDGAMWFIGANNTIGRMTMIGNLTEWVVPTLGDLNDIVAGPDGALWYTNFGAGVVGRITTAGVITEFPTTEGGNPHSITSGPDGALWFTEHGTDTIGRITTAGAITHFPLPPGSNPSRITVGPDGALWFTEPGTQHIGRMTTSGSVTHYPLPPFTNPYFITPGPDNALWVSTGGVASGGVWRITTAGVITFHAFPSMVFGMTTGPDGSLWARIERGVARITPRGVVTHYILAPPNSGFSGVHIAAGPDGALWFPVSTAVLRAPACGLGLRAAFADTTLSMRFALGTTAPATFLLGYYSQNGETPLHSRSVGVTVPPATFTVPWGPGFPDEGVIKVVAALKDPTTDEFLCAEWQYVDTSQ